MDGFRAKGLPVIEIFPPVLQSFVWGGNVASSPLNFTAGYTCDNKGKQFLSLFTDQGELLEGPTKLLLSVAIVHTAVASPMLDC